MPRQGRTLPARRQRTAGENSLLIRSAESLGRMIGSLQRQLDGASRALGKGRGGNGAGSTPSGARLVKKPNGAGSAAASGRTASRRGTSQAATSSRAAAKPASGKATARRSAGPGAAKSGARRAAKRKSPK